MKRAATVVASALVFGVVAGGSMVGVNVVAQKAGVVQTAQAVQETEAAESSAAANETAAAQQESTSTATASAVSSGSVSDVVKEAMPSVVAITNMVKYQQNGYSIFGNYSSQEYEAPASGSGVIIGKTDTELLIATNNHVVADSSSLSVTFCDDQTIDAQIKGTDASNDLAVVSVKLSDIPSDTLNAIKVITIGSSDDAEVGDQVVAIGNALGYGQSVTTGIISAKDRDVETSSGTETGLMQTDAAINPGNSGGALVNARGELVGINAMLYSQTGSFSGYGFAIPTSIMNKVVSDLKKYGTVQRAVIGIQGQDVKTYVDAQKEKGKEVDLGTMEGIYVAKVTEQSAAEEADLKEGDVITAVDGKTVSKMAELQEILAQKRPGDKVSITYLRDKKKATKTVTLKNEQGNTKLVQKADLDILGGTFREITDAQKRSLGISYGVEVTKLSGGKLKEQGMTPKFVIQKVNDQSIRTVDELQQAVKDASTSKEPVLYIQGVTPTGQKKYYAISLE